MRGGLCEARKVDKVKFGRWVDEETQDASECTFLCPYGTGDTPRRVIWDCPVERIRQKRPKYSEGDGGGWDEKNRETLQGGLYWYQERYPMSCSASEILLRGGDGGDMGSGVHFSDTIDAHPTAIACSIVAAPCHTMPLGEGGMDLFSLLGCPVRACT